MTTFRLGLTLCAASIAIHGCSTNAVHTPPESRAFTIQLEPKPFHAPAEQIGFHQPDPVALQRGAEILDACAAATTPADAFAKIRNRVICARIWYWSVLNQNTKRKRARKLMIFCYRARLRFAF